MGAAPVPRLSVRRVAPNAAFRFEVERDLHVNAAVSEVAVIGSLVVELVEQLPQIAQVRAELFRRDGRVVPTFPSRRQARTPGSISSARLPSHCRSP